MDIKSVLKEICLDGGPGICLFSLCEPEASGELRTVNMAAAERAVKILYENGVRQVIFTGKSVFGYPDGDRLVKAAAELGMRAEALSRLGEAEASKLPVWVKAGLSKVYLNVGSLFNALDDKEIFLSGCGSASEIVKAAAGLGGLDTEAVVTLEKPIDPETACSILEQLGFKAVSFDLSGIKIGSGAEAGEGPAVEEVLAFIDRAAGIKKEEFIINPPGYWNDMRNLFTGERQSYVCQGGYKLFYLDAALRLRRCPGTEEALCPIEAFNGSQSVRDGCVNCPNALFRCRSIGLQSLTSFSDGVHSLCFSQPSRAARQWLDPRNIESLKFFFKNMKNY